MALSDRSETPAQIIWRLEKQSIALRERAERAEAKLRKRGIRVTVPKAAR